MLDINYIGFYLQRQSRNMIKYKSETCNGASEPKWRMLYTVQQQPD